MYYNTEVVHKAGIVDHLIPVLVLIASVLIGLWEVIPRAINMMSTLYLGDMSTGVPLMAETGVVFILWAVILYIGGSGILRLYRFKRYARKIGTDKSIELMYFADIADETEAFVIKDVKKMIKKGWFQNAVIDEEKALLIIKD
jgi:hypothetical protein